MSDKKGPANAAQKKAAGKPAGKSGKDTSKKATAEPKAAAKDAPSKAKPAKDAGKKKDASSKAKAAKDAGKKAGKTDSAAKAKPDAKAKAVPDNAKEAEDAPDAKEPAKEEPYKAKAKPELDDEARAALRERAAKQKRTPAFRRHEWWRYKRLGGKDAPWRKPRGIHSKQRRHFRYRPPVVSIGYRTPEAARGLHPSGFEEVLVHRPADLETLDPKRQAARIGRTVGGRKAGAIQTKADEMGVRILNRRDL